MVIFDCDGVMFDTTKANTVYYNTILGHFGRPPMNDSQVAFIHMHTVHESVAYLLGDDPDMIKTAQAFRERMPYEQFLEQMEMEPDLIPLLDHLRPRFKTAIATNRTDTMDRVIAAFDLAGRFDLVVCAHDVEHPKPAPDSLNRVLAHFGIPPEQAVYIGDSELDERAARAAGIRFIAYGNPSLPAHRHVRRLGEVAALVEQLWRT